MTQAIAIREAPSSPGGGPLAPGPTALWPGYTDSFSVEFGLWGPPTQTSWTTGVPDHYVIYRDGARLYGFSGPTSVPWSATNISGIVGTTAGTTSGSHPVVWYCDRTVQPGETHTYTATCVDSAGVESAPSPPLTLTARVNGPTIRAAQAAEPDGWIEPYALPNVTPIVVTQTAAGSYNATGGLGWAISQCDIDGPNIIVLPAGQTITLPVNGARLPAFTGNGGWTYIISSEDPAYKRGGKLIPYSYTPTKRVPLVYTLNTFNTGGNSTGAVTATLSAPWDRKSGHYYVIFSDGEERFALFTAGSATIDWGLTVTYNSAYIGGAGLAANVTTTIHVVYETGVTPYDALIGGSMPVLNFGTAFTTCVTIPAACNKVRFVGIAMMPLRGYLGNSDIYEGVWFSGQASPDGGFLPLSDSIYFDRCLIGDDITAAGVNPIIHAIGIISCNHFLVHQCYFWNGATNLGPSATDSNALAFQSGQYSCVQNSYVSAVKESFMFGGVYIPRQALPQDFVYRYNTSHKPLMWGPNQCGNTSALYKTFTSNVGNLGEFKCMVRADLYGNLQLNCWTASAPGYHGAAFGMGTRDQGASAPASDNYDHTCPWNVVRDIKIHDNLCYNVEAAFVTFSGDNITGYDGLIEFYNNIVFFNPANPNPERCMCMRMMGPCVDHFVDHNTFIVNMTLPMTTLGIQGFCLDKTGMGAGSYQNPLPNTFDAWSAWCDGLTFTNNIVDGLEAFSFLDFAPNFSDTTKWRNLTLNKNITVSDSRTYNWPQGTTYNHVPYASLGFANFVTNTTIPLQPTDWNVVSGPYATASTTGGPIGAIWTP